MKYSKNLELDMLFRKYFFLLKKEKINLIKNHNETNYLDLSDGFLESNDLVNFSNDKILKKQLLMKLEQRYSLANLYKMIFIIVNFVK